MTALYHVLYAVERWTKRYYGDFVVTVTQKQTTEGWEPIEVYERRGDAERYISDRRNLKQEYRIVEL